MTFFLNFRKISPLIAFVFTLIVIIVFLSAILFIYSLVVRSLFSCINWLIFFNFISSKYNILFKTNIINNVNYEFLLNANLIMCLLNLLPIFPLDGFIVIKAILQLLIPYKNVLKVSTIISLISFIGFCIYNIFDFQPMVLFFLLIEQIKYILSYKNNYKNFLIYKTLFKKERSFCFRRQLHSRV